MAHRHTAGGTNFLNPGRQNSGLVFMKLHIRKQNHILHIPAHNLCKIYNF